MWCSIESPDCDRQTDRQVDVQVVLVVRRQLVVCLYGGVAVFVSLAARRHWVDRSLRAHHTDSSLHRPASSWSHQWDPPRELPACQPPAYQLHCQQDLVSTHSDYHTHTHTHTQGTWLHNSHNRQQFHSSLQTTTDYCNSVDYIQETLKKVNSLAGWPGPESAAAQRWSSTIGCPAWQPRPRYLSCVTDVYIYDVLWSSSLSWLIKRILLLLLVSKALSQARPLVNLWNALMLFRRVAMHAVQTDRQTDRQTNTHTNHNTPLLSAE